VAQGSGTVPIKTDFSRHIRYIFGFTFWTGHNTPLRQKNDQGRKCCKVAGINNFTGRSAPQAIATVELIGQFLQVISYWLSSNEKRLKKFYRHICVIDDSLKGNSV